MHEKTRTATRSVKHAYGVARRVSLLQEKGGKSREIPVRHDLEGFILAYVEAAGLVVRAWTPRCSGRAAGGRGSCRAGR